VTRIWNLLSAYTNLPVGASLQNSGETTMQLLSAPIGCCREEGKSSGVFILWSLLLQVGLYCLRA
jgi:hypothetical protein